MTKFFQITNNEVISGICKAIHNEYGDTLKIYKEQRSYLDLPAVCVYCIHRGVINERADRFVNVFNIIINYFPEDSVTINNKRTDMSTQAERIMDAIRYIPLPAYKKNSSGLYDEIILPSRASNIQAEEKEGFMQIAVTYTVRTKQVFPDIPTMGNIDCTQGLKQI